MAELLQRLTESVLRALILMLASYRCRCRQYDSTHEACGLHSYREVIHCCFLQKMGVMKKSEYPASFKYYEELKERPGYKKATADHE